MAVKKEIVRTGWQDVWGFLLLVLAAPITIALLAGWGFVDNWLRSHRAAQHA